MKRKLMLTVVALLVSAWNGYSQMLGFELSYGMHKQQGSYQGPCGCVDEYNSGTGGGSNIAASYSLPWTPGLIIGGSVSVDFKNISTSYDVSDVAIVNYTKNGIDMVDSTSTLSIEHDISYGITYLSFIPYLQYYPLLDGPFVRIGPAVSTTIANHVSIVRKLKSNQFVTRDGSTVTNLRFPNGTNTETLQDSQIPDINSIQFSALVSIGYDIKIFQSAISPTITYDYPLSVIRSTNASGWKISSLYGGIGFTTKL